MGVATLGPGDPPADKDRASHRRLAAIVAGGEKGEETPEPEPVTYPHAVSQEALTVTRRVLVLVVIVGLASQPCLPPD